MDYIIGILQGVIIVWMIILNSYAKKKGENLATKEDIEEITRKVESVKTEYMSQLEKLKSELDKTVYISKVQFEAEFNIYKEIWSELINLEHATKELRPMLDSGYKPGETKEQRKAERSKIAQEAHQSFVKLIDKYRPFYPQKIWEELNKLLNITWGEAVDYFVGDPKADHCTYWKESKENMDNIVVEINLICEAIRNRLAEVKIV